MPSSFNTGSIFKWLYVNNEVQIKIVAIEIVGIIMSFLSLKGFIKNKIKANAPTGSVTIMPIFEKFVKITATMNMVTPDTSIGRFIFYKPL